MQSMCDVCTSRSSSLTLAFMSVDQLLLHILLAKMGFTAPASQTHRKRQLDTKNDHTRQLAVTVARCM